MRLLGWMRRLQAAGFAAIGLLIALAEGAAARLETKLPDAYRIGQVTHRQIKPIVLTSVPQR